MKGHKFVLILTAAAVLAAAAAAAIYLAVSAVPQKNRDAAAVPDQQISSGNLSYSTANPGASQENGKNNESALSSGTEGAASATQKKEDSVQETYLVKAYDGAIAVFTAGSDTPLRTIEVNPATLPESDQDALEKGITVQGPAQLRQLLEDYES